jgi:hypothetical protein
MSLTCNAVTSFSVAASIVDAINYLMWLFSCKRTSLPYL